MNFHMIRHRPRRFSAGGGLPGRRTTPGVIGLVALAATLVGIAITQIGPQALILVVFSGLVILSSWLMMQKAVGVFNLQALTIPGFTYLMYFVLIVLPAFYVYGEQVEPFRTTYIFAVLSVLITVPAGIILVNFILHFGKREITDYYQAPIRSETASPAGYTLLVIIALALTAVNFWEVRTVPLLYLIQNPGDYFGVAMLREEAGKLLNSPLSYAYFVLKIVVYPFLILLACSRYLASKRIPWLVTFLGLLLVGIIYCGMAVEKGVVAAIFAELFILFYLYKGGRPGKAAILLAPIAFFAFPAFILSQQYRGLVHGTPAGIASDILERVFHGPASVLYYYFEVFPAALPYQYGGSIGKFSVLMGWRSSNIPNAVGLYITHGARGTLESVNANAAFIGNLNADFGLVGVLLGGVIAGMVLQAAQIHLLRRPKTEQTLAICAFWMWTFSCLYDTPLPAVLLSYGVLLAPVILWVMKLCEPLSPARLLPRTGARMGVRSVRAHSALGVSPPPPRMRVR